MEDSSEKQIDIWIDKKLTTTEDVVEAWKEFDGVRGERLVCQDNRGKILEITGGVDSPLLPLVKFVELIDIGKQTERESGEQKLPIPEFLALEPKIIDSEKITNQEDDRIEYK